jgi:hypothetical protein
MCSCTAYTNVRKAVCIITNQTVCCCACWDMHASSSTQSLVFAPLLPLSTWVSNAVQMCECGSLFCAVFSCCCCVYGQTQSIMSHLGVRPLDACGTICRMCAACRSRMENDIRCCYCYVCLCVGNTLIRMVLQQCCLGVCLCNSSQNV